MKIMKKKRKYKTKIKGSEQEEVNKQEEGFPLKDCWKVMNPIELKKGIQ